jgi:N-hydroxyarylamine O-acetyltransferase
VSFDLDVYLRRIRWDGPRRTDVDTLAGLLAAHLTSIPFENLDVLLGRPPRLDLEALQEKIVRDGRGGYCFEQATLFAAALEALGFRPERHAARVTLFMPRSAVPRTHMFLTVPLAEGTFVVDPGFGALAPRIPVPLADGIEVAFGADAYAMVRDGDHWVLRVRTEGGTVDAWASTLAVENPADFVMANHYTSTYPASPFVSRLMLRAFTAEGRVSVMNRDVTIARSGHVETAELADRAALRALLVEHFGFDLPEVEALRVPSLPEW